MIFDSESSGASNDFEQATQLARAMVTQYGMSDKLGTVQLESPGSQPFAGAAYGQGPAYSQETAATIDSEVRRIINEAHENAREIIEAHREQHKIIAEALLKYETLDEKQILSLFKTGKMPEKDDQSEFPSEKAATFEESKKELERREAERHQELEDQPNLMRTQLVMLVKQLLVKLMMIRNRSRTILIKNNKSILEMHKLAACCIFFLLS